MNKLRFRQIHLDFHTSPDIPGIGEAFDKKQWQETLQRAHVNSITCFALCHHGWSYHPAKVGRIHPGLKFNLLREQIDACHEVGINVPVYISAGQNDRLSEIHSNWRQIAPDGTFSGWTKEPFRPGFKLLCFNSAYLDCLCAMTEEVATLFPDADGLFFDIIHQRECCCPKCIRDMIAGGFDPEKPEDRKCFAHQVILNYHRRATAAARVLNPNMPVYHNKDISPDVRDTFPYYSHFELESLPTGGWGYDHFPLAAAYARKLGKDFLGMTGKFHTTWGEFGGFKHPNALRYECAAMLASNSKCSIGDQLHPSGCLDKSTYELIGNAYKEVEEKEPWCVNAVVANTVAVLSNKSAQPNASATAILTGVSRFLLEEHIPFDILDETMPYDGYKILILADNIRIDTLLKARLDTFLSSGGKLILSGSAGLKKKEDSFAFDLGCSQEGLNSFSPDYIQAAEAFAPEFVKTPFVMYAASRRIKVNRGTTLGKVFDPYFNRTYRHFCSHQHTPYRTENSGYDAGVLTDRILYFAHPVFLLYAAGGSVALRHYMAKAFRALAGDNLPVITDLPSQGRVFLTKQTEERRYILHLLYANTIMRGADFSLPDLYKGGRIEIIEELNPCCDTTVAVKVPEKITKVTIEPQGREMPLTVEKGRIRIQLDHFVCHQMVVLHY